VAILRLFGPAREAAGVGGGTTVEISGRNVAEVLGLAEERYGSAFADVVAVSRIWVNGRSATGETSVDEGDEVAVIPPVSGG
jgi:molybdopterin synthase sulfur carrier subunit